MNTKFFVLTAVVALALFSGVASAQDAGNGSDVGVNVDAGQNSCPEPETIDNMTQICSAELKDGVAVLVLKSHYNQSIIVTDSGDFMAGGEVDQKPIKLLEGENKVRMRVTTVNGYAGVSISTRRVLYAVPVERQSTLISGPFDSNDVQISALGGAASVAIAMIWITIGTLTGKRESPERVA